MVDDELAWRTILETDLRMLGYRVLLAGDAAEAITVATAEMPDVAIIDLMLPEPVSGEALVVELAGRGIVVPVIFYTAYPIFEERADTSAVIGYISKSADRADLYGLIPTAITTGRE